MFCFLLNREAQSRAAPRRPEAGQGATGRKSQDPSRLLGHALDYQVTAVTDPDTNNEILCSGKVLIRVFKIHFSHRQHMTTF